MPVVRFEVAELERLLGKPVSRPKLIETIPMIGADVDDVSGGTWAIEFFPDRPDLYTVEGIARAMRAYLGIAPGLARYDVAPATTHVRVDSSVLAVRPHIAGAFVRGVPITEARLQALIDLQEDLHWGLGVRRKRVAIGLHDASVLAPPFEFLAVKGDAPAFVPLQETRRMTPAELLTQHPKGRDYAHLLAGKDFPLIRDSAGGVVSLPPIINAARTTVTTETTDLFVDVTGTDAWAVERALNILVTALAEAGGRIEAVEIRRPDGSTLTTPRLASEARTLPVAEANRLLGVEFTPQEIADRLQRMGFGAAVRGNEVAVDVPPYRVDILHTWDLIEDVAIGHGLNNFSHMGTQAPTTGAPIAENLVAARARASLVGLGFLEAMGLTLSNDRDQFVRMQRVPGDVVRVKNPVTEDHTILRPSLLPGLLAILRKNAHRDLPQRLFEVGMVARLENGRPVFERRVSGVVAAARASFTDVKGVALALARDLGWPGADTVAKGDDPAFLTGRVANLGAFGVLGEVHPAVLEAFGIGAPVAAFEFRLADGPHADVRGPTDSSSQE